MKNPLAAVPLIALALLASACGSRDDGESRSVLSRVSEKVETKVRHQMATQNLTLSADDGSAPAAELTPTGDLLIDGAAVAMTDSQRALALKYRSELAAIAEAGAAIGMQGAELATQAMAEAARSLVDSDDTPVEERIAARAEGVRAGARALCERLPKLLAAQDALAAALPDFAPYAEMNLSDIEECRTEVDEAAAGG